MSPGKEISFIPVFIRYSICNTLYLNKRHLPAFIGSDDFTHWYVDIFVLPVILNLLTLIFVVVSLISISGRGGTSISGIVGLTTGFGTVFSTADSTAPALALSGIAG